MHSLNNIYYYIYYKIYPHLVNFMFNVVLRQLISKLTLMLLKGMFALYTNQCSQSGISELLSRDLDIFAWTLWQDLYFFIKVSMENISKTFEILIYSLNLNQIIQCLMLTSSMKSDVKGQVRKVRDLTKVLRTVSIDIQIYLQNKKS